MVDVNTPAAGGRVYYGLAAAAAAAIMVVRTIIARDENKDLLCLFGLRMPFCLPPNLVAYQGYIRVIFFL